MAEVTAGSSATSTPSGSEDTSSPSASRWAMRCRPTKPPAPVTKARISWTLGEAAYEAYDAAFSSW